MWLHDVFGDPAWRSLTWTLLHFLWQGLIVASVWKVLFRLAAARKVQVHYLLGLIGMVVMASCPVVTFVLLESESGWHGARLVAAPTLATAMPDAPGAVSELATSVGVVSRSTEIGWTAAPWKAALAERIGDVQPYLLSGWIMGLTLLSGRLLLGVVAAHQLGRGRQPVTDELARRTAALAGRMGFGRVPGVFASRTACEAVVVRVLRPMVLLPVAWLAEMTPDVLEAVIAHELAHIRRHDLWANLFQRLVETLLFYHPAIWWLSRRVRASREMCCDELAARATGNCVVYATALELAARRRQAPARSFLEVALGVTHMTLLNRVRNVLGLVVRHEQGRWWPAAVLALLVPPAVWLASMAAATSAEDKVESVPAYSFASSPAIGRATLVNEEGRYTATALFRVALEKPSVSGGTIATDRDSFEIYKATQQQLLKSRFLLRTALRQKQVANLASVQRLQKSGDPVAWLVGRLQVTFPGKAEIMEVSLSGDDANEAAILLNAVVDTYLDDVVNAELIQKRQRLGQLDDACVSMEKKLRDKREEIKKTADEVGTSDTEILSMKQKLALEELAAYRQQLLSLDVELRRLSREMAGQEAVLRDANTEERAAIRKAIKRLETEREVGSEQRDKLVRELESKRREAEKFGNSNVVIEMMRSDIKNTDAMMTKISREREELRLEVNARPRVTLLQKAEVPGAADK